MVTVKTYNIITLKKVVQGTSGGISLPGFVGSIFIAFSAIYWWRNDLIQFFPIVIFTGLFGNIIDSILGSLLQAHYEKYTKSCLYLNIFIINLFSEYT
jgi:uncharacterized membrane protein